MRIRIRFLIQLINFDADPGYQNDADPCGYGSKTLFHRVLEIKPSVHVRFVGTL
jgi:hypothetical protein